MVSIVVAQVPDEFAFGDAARVMCRGEVSNSGTYSREVAICRDYHCVQTKSVYIVMTQ